MKKLVLATLAAVTLAGAAQAEYVFANSAAGYVGYINIHNDDPITGGRDLPIFSNLGMEMHYGPYRVAPGTIVEYKDTMGHFYSYEIPKGWDLNIGFNGTVFVSDINAWITPTVDPQA